MGTERIGCMGAVGAFLLLAASASEAPAHPVPQGTHDRTITVQLMPTEVVVQYRLEIHPHTLIFTDLQREVEQGLISEPKEFFTTFERLYRTRLAAGLTAELDGKPLVFTCTDAQHQWLNQGKEDEQVRYDFLFVARWKPEDRPDHQFSFSDKNYEKDGQPMPGRVQLNLAADPSLNVSGSLGPLAAGVRDLRAGFNLSAEEQEDEDTSLLHLYFKSEKGFWVMLLLAVGLGGAHALTPGHGKTLVAAYLIGERGTMRHAIVLGLVTTLTHTGVVLILALVLWLSFPNGISSEERSSIQQALGLGGGLLIAALGLWLLFRRLSGKADHIHLGGAGHHHHHDHDHDHDHHGHDHSHDHGHSHDHVHPMQGGWRGLVALGISGGIVPCWDAVALLLAAVAMNMLWLALPMLLAFSAGLAGVLVVIGILVVRTKALAGKRWEKSRLFRALPLMSAAIVTCLGLWLCYVSLP